MAKGKIQIKRIDNSTNRQVTYSKRRSGLFKKANELAVLCDAKVSILLLSSSGKLQEYISPSTTTKDIFDQYQKNLGIDLWSSHYERMQEQLKKLKDVNANLRKQIRQRFGECLNDMSIGELQDLEQDMENSVKLIRDRKFRVIGNQTDIYKKKVRSATEMHQLLLQEFEIKGPHYGLVDNGGEYDNVIGFSDECPRIFAFRLEPNYQPNNVHGGRALDLTTYSLH